MSPSKARQARPKIYHLTHVRNLPGIIHAGALWSDAKRIELAIDCEVVGMSSIKERRLNLPVKCHPRTTVGQYVPFYFCARSIMLYILHMGNHPDLTYHGGQRPIVHLVADLRATVAAGQDVHPRPRPPDQPPPGYQLPDQAPLARQEDLRLEQPQTRVHPRPHPDRMERSPGTRMARFLRP